MTKAQGVYYALEAARHGYSVSPVDHLGNPLTEGGAKDATLDPDKIHEMWAKHPQAYVGMLSRKEPISATPYEYRDPASIPRRDWIYGNHLIRGFGSATVAPGGVGKSTLVLAEAIAIAIGRPILGIQPKKRGRVWYWNGEDPLEEIERRVAAIVLHYKIDPDELDGWFFYDSGREQKIILAQQTRDGAVVAEPVANAIIETLIDNEIDVLTIDPFISSHRVTENDNNAIDIVSKRWTAIADEAQCAIELVHHVRKIGGSQATVEDARGAIALIAAVRSARVLNVMTKKEGHRTGVASHRRYFRVENGKNNLAPPPEVAEWYEIRSVPLGNGDGLLQAGDDVGVATPWKWLDPLAGLSGADFEAAAGLIRAGRWRASPQATQWVGNPIAQALGLDLKKKADKARVAAIIKVWLAAGSIRVVEGLDEKSMPRKFVEVSDDSTPSTP